MKRSFAWLAASVLATLGATPGTAADATTGADPSAVLTVDQIVERHVAARGGAEAWRQIKTMAWTGHIESGPGGIEKVPYLLLFQRPNATHFEVMAQHQKSVRIFDGSKGWKLLPAGNGLPELRDYSDEELSFARDASGLDGPLFDYKAKGVSVALAGMDHVEGREAYRLQVTLPSGQTHTDWIDAHSFLQLKYDRATRNAAGRTGIVSVYLRDYQTIKGLVMPFSIETGAAGGAATDRMIIEKIALNPTLEAGAFMKPVAPRARRNGILVNTESPPAVAPAAAH